MISTACASLPCTDTKRQFAPFPANTTGNSLFYRRSSAHTYTIYWVQRTVSGNVATSAIRSLGCNDFAICPFPGTDPSTCLQPCQRSGNWARLISDGANLFWTEAYNKAGVLDGNVKRKPLSRRRPSRHRHRPDLHRHSQALHRQRQALLCPPRQRWRGLGHLFAAPRRQRHHPRSGCRRPRGDPGDPKPGQRRAAGRQEDDLRARLRQAAQRPQHPHRRGAPGGQAQRGGSARLAVGRAQRHALAGRGRQPTTAPGSTMAGSSCCQPVGPKAPSPSNSRWTRAASTPIPTWQTTR